MYVEGDLPVMTYGNCNNNGNNGWNDWSWIIGLALVGGLFGNGGFGFGGVNRGGFGGDFAGWQLGRLATTNDVASGCRRKQRNLHPRLSECTTHQRTFS